MDIPFESFSNLIYRLSHPPKSKSSQQPILPSKIFRSWLDHLPRPFPPGTGKHLFRLLYPQEGSRRRYGFKEYKLASEIEGILCVEGLTKWDAVGWGDAGTGCLGKEVERAMRSRLAQGTKSKITIRQVDKILDDLAAHSSFSQLSLPPPEFPSQVSLLTQLYRDSDLSPYSLSLITQIILRDLRPLLNPLPSLRVRNPTAMLRLKTTSGPAQLEMSLAMRCWHPQMYKLYMSGLGDLDACAEAVEKMSTGFASSSRGPVVGVNVQIPKCMKGRSVEDALNEFCRPGKPSASEIWAETKYDGYRMQIHVELPNGREPVIKIFSKSKRDSTQDRIYAHAIILAALDLPLSQTTPTHSLLVRRQGSPPSKSLKRSIILEAEIVPYNEGNREGNRARGIEEFWWLGAAGVTATATGPRFRLDGNRHLCLVLFDILHLDGQSLLNLPLIQRRILLRQYTRPIDGFCKLADFSVISLEKGRSSALLQLQESFQTACRDREEGLVLKASDSTYLDPRWRWVKLKDYIPDLGDCIDLVLLGAGWDPDRARELRVDTSVFTTFYLGVLTNSEAVKAKIETPHFEVLFPVSYGLSRDQLESVNGAIRHGKWASKPYDRDDRFKRRLLGLSWTFTIAQGLRPPAVLFEHPLCAEVMGAGFQRLAGMNQYELRWPRLQKIFDARERSWTEALTSGALLETAHKALGYSKTPGPPTSPSSSRDDSIKALWRSSSAIDLTDISELVTPSPERRSPRRMKSAPDLMGLVKFTPSSSSRYTGLGMASRWLFEDSVETGPPIVVDRNDSVIGEPVALNPPLLCHSEVRKRKRCLEPPLFERDDGKRLKRSVYLDDQESPLALTPLEPNIAQSHDRLCHPDLHSKERVKKGNDALMTSKVEQGHRKKKRRILSLRSRIKRFLSAPSA